MAPNNEEAEECEHTADGPTVDEEHRPKSVLFLKGTLISVGFRLACVVAIETIKNLVLLKQNKFIIDYKKRKAHNLRLYHQIRGGRG